MTGTNHALTGALIAVVVKKPELALPLAFFAHFAIDAIPHWNYGLKGKARRLVMRGDLTLSLTLLIVLGLIVTAPAWLVIACGLLCMAPDALWLPEILQGKPPVDHQLAIVNNARSFHRFVQWCEQPWGLYVEFVWFVAVLALILSIGR